MTIDNDERNERCEDVYDSCARVHCFLDDGGDAGELINPVTGECDHDLYAGLYHLQDAIAIIEKYTEENTLRCPECGRLHILSHDEWSAIVCLGCKVEIHKSDIRASK